MVMLVPPRAIPCRQCGSEFLLRNGQPECGLGRECELFAFVRSVLDQPLNERSALWATTPEPKRRPATPPPVPMPMPRAKARSGKGGKVRGLEL